MPGPAILVTAATGKTGAAVVDRLVREVRPVRAPPFPPTAGAACLFR